MHCMCFAAGAYLGTMFRRRERQEKRRMKQLTLRLPSVRELRLPSVRERADGTCPGVRVSCYLADVSHPIALMLF